MSGSVQVINVDVDGDGVIDRLVEVSRRWLHARGCARSRVAHVLDESRRISLPIAVASPSEGVA